MTLTSQLQNQEDQDCYFTIWMQILIIVGLFIILFIVSCLVLYYYTKERRDHLDYKKTLLK